ncbi:MAG: hypothetical protein H7067_17565 [Burkholderiales bacterium]|nr:hypothetical protein [Opitutaceae bacterium]
MKLKSIVLPILAAFVSCLPVSAAEAGPGHDHGHSHAKKESGPNGGRLLTKIDPHAEFFVTAERKVRITFLDEQSKAVAPGTQVVVVTTGERAAPTVLTFAKEGDALISEAALPAGNDFPTVVQIKLTPEAKVVVERFNLNLSTCSECSKPEYACVCAH